MRLLLFVSMALAGSAAAVAAQDAALQGRGERLLQAQCGYCHAVGLSGESAHKAALPFRELMKRYPPESLEEALGEGLSTGHPDMPEFVFEPPEIAAIVAYLDRLRSRR
jgi:mono/diheme cytochrome c family protein